MKVVLYMAITANSMIAKEDDDTSFVSDAEWDSFTKVLKQAGNYVMGRRTYEESVNADVFPYDCLNVVMTKQKIKNKWGDRVIFTDKSPREVLNLLKEKGFATAFIGGGGELNASFMRDGLIDEIFIDVEPWVYGKGIPLFAPTDFEVRLELLDTKKLSDQTIQLHYRVKK